MHSGTFGIRVKRVGTQLKGASSLFWRKMASSVTGTKPKNRLKNELSPYLLQHQENPVDWYPWSTEAFQLAKTLNKPIFLSVGYSTCHWCHVMERESFENDSIAKVMNEKFINIKMDREERPDIDRIYMTVVQAISGSGGWPMSVWMTPELKPFYAGTYYPPDDRYYGRPGFRALLETLSEHWTENEEKCQESANKIIDAIKLAAKVKMNESMAVDEEASKRCVQQLTRSFEPSYGGFSDHPKFPQPVNLIFLMDWALKNPNESNKFSVVKMVETTLKEMAKGGIHDHVGQGFARYSTDKKWHVPHFEKMLYDQAQLTIAYSNAYLLTGNQFYADIVEDILTYVGRDLGHPEGGFYSAEDADSYATFDSKEKREGAFYVWKESEIDEILGDKALPESESKTRIADVFKQRYGVKPKGNVDPFNDPHDELKEQNILFEAQILESLAKKFGVPESVVTNSLDEAKISLFNYRNINRPRPGLDTKLITSWNGLMISGYARAGMALKSKEYIDRAVKGMEFLVNRVFKSEANGKVDLLRTCYSEKKGDAVVNLKNPIYGCVDDFANVIAASIDLFHATNNIKYLKQAVQLQQIQDELFWDEKGAGYFTSRAGDAAVIIRMKDDDDGAEPSSNSTSVANLIRLGSFLRDKRYLDKAELLFRQFSDRLAKIPITLPVMTSCLSTFTKGPHIFVYNAEAPTASEIRQKLLPNGSALIGIKPGDSSSKEEIASFLPPAREALSKDPNLSKMFSCSRNEDSWTEVASLDEMSKVWTN